MIAAEVLAVVQLWNFEFSPEYLKEVDYPQETLAWPIGQRYNAAVWVTIFLAIILVVNCLPVLAYGWIEYVFGCLKMFFVVGSILFNMILNARKLSPRQNSNRFWTYSDPYGFSSQNITLGYRAGGAAVVKTGSAGVFLALWSAMTTIIFSMIWIEAVSITSGENKDLRRTESIKTASRKIILRVVLLYTLATFTVGLNVPYTDPNLIDYAVNNLRSGQHSIFILSAVRNGLTFWPDFFNGFFMFSATAAGINSLYIASRILHSLAERRNVWPNISRVQAFRKKLQQTRHGVPYYAVFVSWLFGLLAYLATKLFPAIVGIIEMHPI